MRNPMNIVTDYRSPRQPLLLKDLDQKFSLSKQNELTLAVSQYFEVLKHVLNVNRVNGSRPRQI